MNSTEGNESARIFWSFTHNDVAFKSERLQRWAFAPEYLPYAQYGFSRAPVLETELMVFWSEDSGTLRVKQRGFFPFNFRQGTKEPRNSSAIFANFIYQVSVRVDSNDIKDDYSWIMGGDAADDPVSDELRAAKQGIAHLAPVKLITTRHSECPGSTALTNCYTTESN